MNSLEQRLTVNTEDLKTYREMTAALKADPGNPTNAVVTQNLETVWNALHDPQLIAEVVSDIYAGSLRDPATTPGLDALTRSILRRASDGGAIEIIPSGAGLNNQQFYEHWVMTGRQFLDFDAPSDHGAVVHLIQDAIVTEAFRRAGSTLTGPQFRQLLGQTSVSTPLPNGRVPGERLWVVIYDSFSQNINQPERLMGLLRRIPRLKELS